MQDLAVPVWWRFGIAAVRPGLIRPTALRSGLARECRPALLQAGQGLSVTTTGLDPLRGD